MVWTSAASYQTIKCWLTPTLQARISHILNIPRARRWMKKCAEVTMCIFANYRCEVAEKWTSCDHWRDGTLLFAESVGWVQQGTGSIHQRETRKGVRCCCASMGRLPQRGEPQGRVPYTLNSECYSVYTQILPLNSRHFYYTPSYTDTLKTEYFACFYSIMTLLCIKLHSKHCLLCIALHQVKLRT